MILGVVVPASAPPLETPAAAWRSWQRSTTRRAHASDQTNNNKLSAALWYLLGRAAEIGKSYNVSHSTISRLKAENERLHSSNRWLDQQVTSLRQQRSPVPLRPALISAGDSRTI